MHPVIVALPYLPLGRELDVGPWRAEPLAAYSGEWLSDDFERLCRVFLGAFRRPKGEPLENPAVVTRVGSGADGVPPTEAEHRSLMLAIGFAVLDANPDWEPDADGWSCATADNAQLWIQPIDVTGARFSLESGYRVRTLAGGLRLNDELVIPVPVEVHFPFAVMPDSELATIMYDVALREDQSDPEFSRLFVAVDWLIASWRNTPSLSWESRLVQMKTAFEALLDESDTAKALQLLRRLFEEAEPHQTDGALAAERANQAQGRQGQAVRRDADRALVRRPIRRSQRNHPRRAPRTGGLGLRGRVAISRTIRRRR